MYLERWNHATKHFAGFSPQSANTFLKLMDKHGIEDWSKDIEQWQNNSYDIKHKHQTSLSDCTHLNQNK
jgi:hypothetical protein